MQLERLYVLDPYGGTAGEPAPAGTHFKNVVRSAEPAPEDRRNGRAHRGVRNIMEATTTTGVSCVDFVHGATFRGSRGTYAVLVSIGCGNYRIYGQSKDEGMGDAFAAAETNPWYGAFEAAGLLKKRQ